MRRLRLALLLVLVAGAAFGVQASVAHVRNGNDGLPETVAAGGLAALRGVNFVTVCGFSHRNRDDMIVFPDEPGLSHDHTYFGARTTSAGSTVETLKTGGTTCRRPGDTAAYWVPTLFRDGVAMEPLGATIYYRRRTIERVRPFPPGLELIAGNGTATSPQARRVTFWNCGVRGGLPPSSEPPDCPEGAGTGLRLHITFPSCWDGANLDSPDHQSHMAYAERGRCPSTHPVEVPAISLIVRYGITNSAGLELASGGVYSAHADFVNAWDQRALRHLVERCLNGLRHCGRGIA
jgi:hypothetical protein